MKVVFPAYAGVNPRRSTRSAMTGSIPRVCGGEPWGVSEGLIFDRYSPRMRG